MSEIPHTDDWQDYYPTTTFRGPQQYPTPEEWVLSGVEADGVRWKRYEDIGEECHKDHEVIEARDYSMNAGTPDEEAGLGRGLEFEPVEIDGEHELKPVADPADHELRIGGETIFRVYDPIDTGQLWAATAAILTRHSRGEDYDTIADAIDEWVDPTDPGENATLDAFDGSGGESA
jgi:hypothetical protein